MQQLIGEAILICENVILTTDINTLNERLYRTERHRMTRAQADNVIKAIKFNEISLIARMRENVKETTRFERENFPHI